jgi:tripartite-type tricarboxylate transporter receptor subunit TctC
MNWVEAMVPKNPDVTVSKSLFSLALGGLLLLALMVAGKPTAAAGPDGYPDRPITLFVPYGEGGGSDQLSRTMAESIEAAGPIRFDVQNRPGQAGQKVIPEFMATPSDGYTVIQHIDDAVSAYAAGSIPENPAEDWIPLAMVQITFSQLYIRGDDPRFSDWDSFLEYARENPQELVIANVSYDGSMERVNMQRLESALGFKVRQVSFDKPKERYEALLFGRVDLLFEQPGDVSKYLDSKEMKPILTFFSERPEAFADVPTHRDVGADFESLLRFRGFYVKGGTDPEIVSYLEDVFRSGFESQIFQEFNRKKYMHLIDSYRDREQSIGLIGETVTQYQATYQDMLYEVLQDYIKESGES